jgi:hypothetical protein
VRMGRRNAAAAVQNALESRARGGVRRHPPSASAMPSCGRATSVSIRPLHCRIYKRSAARHRARPHGGAATPAARESGRGTQFAQAGRDRPAVPVRRLPAASWCREI